MHHHGMGGIFPPLSYEAACVSMQTCTVALWQSLLELVYTLRLLERGNLTLQFYCLNLACSYYHLSDAGIWWDGERLMEEVHQTQLWVCELYMVIWWDSQLKPFSPGSCTCLVPWLVRILGEELERELLQFSAQLGFLADVQWGVSPIISLYSIGIDVCKVLQLGNSLYVYIYFAVFFSVAVTQRPECFGIRRPGLSVASITS